MNEAMGEPQAKLNLHDRIILVVLIGSLTFVVSYYISMLGGGEGSDFKNILDPAREWLAGKDIYLPFRLNLDPLAVPYPFTTYLLSVPLTWMVDRFAASFF